MVKTICVVIAGERSKHCAVSAVKACDSRVQNVAGSAKSNPQV